MNEHVVIKLVGGEREGYYVTRRPEPCDMPERYDSAVPLLNVVDGPFPTYQLALAYIGDALFRRHAVTGR